MTVIGAFTLMVAYVFGWMVAPVVASHISKDSGLGGAMATMES